ncbi:MAG: response regulator [Xanthomonadales bacterium]|nr:response regulator [Gammaproteobacteria bacterium]NNL96487.1 response regulator [Xanthomonadales bacterium]
MIEQGRSVLILEPDDGVRSALTSMLQNMDWQVWAYADGGHLEEEIELHQPAILISESLLPDLNADAVLNEARAHEIPVIFLGHGREVQHAVDLMRQGAADFLEKPFPQSRLIEIMDQFVA